MRALSRRAYRPVDRAPRLVDPVTFSRLCRARDFLAAAYSERNPLEIVAREACLSPFHFNRLFARAFAETPHEFQTRMRIERAKKLLLAENHTVTDICMEVGYQSLGSFSMRFRTLTGTSPQTFRREARASFAGIAAHWPLCYVPSCFQQFFVGPL